MHALILGGTGAVGRLTLQHLLERGHRVTALVRRPDALSAHPRLDRHQTTALDCDQQWLAELMTDVDVVISCLGHRVTFSGMYGQPRKLVRDSLRRVMTAMASTGRRANIILLGSSGCSNGLLNEQHPLQDRLAINLIRHLVPPHSDNEQAALLLAEQRNSNPALEWVVVRPDTLTDEASVTPYQTVPSPLRSPIFNAGKSSRINVAHFIGSLVSDTAAWARWRHQMPVLYNTQSD
ncbi:NAD(P)-dependent oxidoreductase [Saccharospirillum impatiens]|uniref:NAD(P)-dependent oxidoreductase n=1 Tax=Saccharospirillum impatiens TaxID=169438 RepID=UPI0004185A63|nr:NAD(P)-binding oxidoreductase [Saccharospirillum impatiens]